MSYKVKKYIKIIALALACVCLFGVTIASIRVITREPNEDNLVYQLYDSDASYIGSEGKDGNGIKWKIKDDGTIIADGTATANTSFEIGTITIPAGTYTFTANDDVDKNKYYVVGLVDGVEVWYSDLGGDDGKTHTFGSETSVTFRIVVLNETEMHSVKFRPCIVTGKDAGKYYA